MALCAARDEVHWLLRHSDNPPQTKSKGKAAEDLVDRQLPELLFHMEELRGKPFPRISQPDIHELWLQMLFIFTILCFSTCS